MQKCINLVDLEKMLKTKCSHAEIGVDTADNGLQEDTQLVHACVSLPSEHLCNSTAKAIVKTRRDTSRAYRARNNDRLNFCLRQTSHDARELPALSPAIAPARSRPGGCKYTLSRAHSRVQNLTIRYHKLNLSSVPNLTSHG